MILGIYEKYMDGEVKRTRRLQRTKEILRARSQRNEKGLGYETR